MCSQASGDRCWSQLVWDFDVGDSECCDCSFEVHRIPEHDRGDHKVEPAGSEALAVEGTVLDQTAAVEAHRASQSVLSLTVVQTDRHAATEFGAL